MEQQDSAQDSHQLGALRPAKQHRDKPSPSSTGRSDTRGVGAWWMIGLTSRRIIQEALTSDGFYELRVWQSRQGRLQVVGWSSRRAHSRGFIGFDQGMPGLQLDTSRDHDSFENLKPGRERRRSWSWTKQPGRKPFAYMIQYPRLLNGSVSQPQRGIRWTGMPAS